MGKFKSIKVARLIITLSVATALGADLVHAQEVENSQAQSESAKITIGAVEDVVLSPWGVIFPARIDTGADLSSLDAREIVVRNNNVEFKLGKQWGNHRVQLPVLEWRQIQTATGTEKRPVVEISICLGSKLFRTPATLKDRSEMVYPFLVGRSALSGHFLVDSSRTRATQPGCPSPTLVSSR